MIIATQAVRFLPYAEQIVALNDGRIVEKGLLEDLIHARGYVHGIYTQHALDDGEESIVPAMKDQGILQRETKPKAVRVEDLEDKRRQRGDFTVYRFFFSQIGIWLTLGLLTVEIAWAFLENFPSKLFVQGFRDWELC